MCRRLIKQAALRNCIFSTKKLNDHIIPNQPAISSMCRKRIQEPNNIIHIYIYICHICIANNIYDTSSHMRLLSRSRAQFKSNPREIVVALTNRQAFKANSKLQYFIRNSIRHNFATQKKSLDESLLCFWLYSMFASGTRLIAGDKLHFPLHF